jgi:hypothetical protein
LPFCSEVGVERQGVDAHELHAGVAGEGAGDVVLGEVPALAVAGRHLEAHAQHHLVADRPQLVGARGAHPPGQQASLLLDRQRLVVIDQALALEHIRQELGADAHRRISVAEGDTRSAPPGAASGHPRRAGLATADDDATMPRSSACNAADTFHAA